MCSANTGERKNGERRDDEADQRRLRKGKGALKIITIKSFCPHCNKMTETIRVESPKCATYLCVECWHEPTVNTKSTISKNVVVGELRKLISAIEQNTS